MKKTIQRAFEDAAFGLQVGDMSGVVSTDSGVHLIMRTAWRSSKAKRCWRPLRRAHAGVGFRREWAAAEKGRRASQQQPCWIESKHMKTWKPQNSSWPIWLGWIDCWPLILFGAAARWIELRKHVLRGESEMSSRSRLSYHLSNLPHILQALCNGSFAFGSRMTEPGTAM